MESRNGLGTAVGALIAAAMGGSFFTMLFGSMRSTENAFAENNRRRVQERPSGSGFIALVKVRNYAAAYQSISRYV